MVVGILVGEGSFGGDGKQPQITLRMHTRHAALFEWLIERFPRTKLYGPYGHDGRSYYQWMARGPGLVARCRRQSSNTASKVAYATRPNVTAIQARNRQ